jgi:hypothetical protein
MRVNERDYGFRVSARPGSATWLADDGWKQRQRKTREKNFPQIDEAPAPPAEIPTRRRRHQRRL